MSPETETHTFPVWRDRANFLVFADLSRYGAGNLQGFEQLWAVQVESQRFVLCCIPFFTYGLALGDTFRTGDDFVVTDVVAKSGRRVIRFWLVGATPAGRDQLLKYLKECAPLHEWRSKNYVAVDVPVGCPSSELTELLELCDAENIEWEWGD